MQVRSPQIIRNIRLNLAKTRYDQFIEGRSYTAFNEITTSYICMEFKHFLFVHRLLCMMKKIRSHVFKYQIVEGKLALYSEMGNCWGVS